MIDQNMIHLVLHPPATSLNHPISHPGIRSLLVLFFRKERLFFLTQNKKYR
jgi:hypothetical protein